MNDFHGHLDAHFERQFAASDANRDDEAPAEHYYDTAREELAADIDGLEEILANSAWLAEHASALLVASESFRGEVYAARSDWLDKRAKELQDIAAKQADFGGEE